MLPLPLIRAAAVRAARAAGGRRPEGQALASDLTLKRGYDHTVRASISALILFIVAVALLIAGWLTVRSVAEERMRLEQSAAKKAREISSALDREILATRSVLTALVASHYLQDGNLADFYEQARRVAADLGFAIVLRDTSANVQVFNTRFPLGSDLLSGASPAAVAMEQEALRNGQAVVSNVFHGKFSNQYVVVVALPVNRETMPSLMLGVAMPAVHFAKFLQNAQLDDQWNATIVGRDRIIIARSSDSDHYVGTAVTVPSDHEMDEDSVKFGTSRGGIPFHWFSHRSKITGWRLAVGIPDHVLESSSKVAVASFVIGSALLLAVGFLVAHRLGGSVSKTIGELEAAAISERKRGDEQFRTLFESVPNGIVAVDFDGRIALVNARVEEMFGYAREELIGQPIEVLVPERQRERHVDLRWAFSRAACARPMGAARDLTGRRKDGSEFPVEIGLNPISTVAGRMVMATVVDVTARRRASERLSVAIAERDDLRRRFMQAQEEERLRLAHELHDQTGQSLTAVMLELKGIEGVVNEHGRDRLRLLRKQLDQMGKSLHRVAWELRPASLDELGLASVLGNYVSQWSEQFGIDADFHCGDARLDALSDEVRTTIYRVVQESLTNVAKHAVGATAVSVVVDRADGTLQVTIEDDGCGFNPKAPALAGGKNRKGLGIAGMRERLSLIGGQFEIESSTGIGTTIFVRIPLERQSEAA
jgi:PAS domain S-box-containing protein